MKKEKQQPLSGEYLGQDWQLIPAIDFKTQQPTPNIYEGIGPNVMEYAGCGSHQIEIKDEHAKFMITAVKCHKELLRECKLALEMINKNAQSSAAYAADMGYINMKHRLQSVIDKAEGRK